jgi:predicted tellurium resistance membrane protein TerC
MEIFTLDYILTFFTLTGLEIVLGIDNVIFIAILVQNLQATARTKARIIGLSLALILRILMLLGVAWIIKLKEPLFTMFQFAFSGRNLLLILGGLFLIVKAALELKEMFQENEHKNISSTANNNYYKVISQIIFIDLILSFDSIITAVGMTESMPYRIEMIILVIVIAMVVMLLSSKAIGQFIYKHQSIKVIALMFIGLIGVMLLLNGFDIEMEKGYLYFAMLFSLATEIINIKLPKKIL